jgi:hypothetical protein
MEDPRSVRIRIVDSAEEGTPRPVRIQRRKGDLRLTEWQELYPQAVAMLKACRLAEHHLNPSPTADPLLGLRDHVDDRADEHEEQW